MTERLKQWRYYEVGDDTPRFLLAENLSTALYDAAELCGGTENLRDLLLDDHEW